MASKVAAQGIAMLPADYWRSQHKLAFHLFLGTHRTSFSFETHHRHRHKTTTTTTARQTATERAQCEYLCKNIETAQQLFDEVLAHVEDVWETIEVYTQRNQMSICLQRYDVRRSSRLGHRPVAYQA
jgi:hypothetical protein